MKKLSVLLLSLVLLPWSTLKAQTEIFNYKQALSGPARTLTVSINSINRTTGEVVFGGGDSRGPNTPGLFFTWIWGDGTSNNGFFPQTKRYTDVTKNYIAKVVTNYSATEKDTVEVLVDFVQGKVTPTTLDPNLKVYIPNQPFAVDGIMRVPFSDNMFAAADRAQLEYLFQACSSIEYDFVNGNVRMPGGKFEQYMFRDSLFPGAYALSLSTPIAFGVGDVLAKGNVDYSSMCHEMGHNYTLNTPANYIVGNRLGGRAFPFYGEAIAQIFQQAAGYELINNYQKYGIDENLLAKLRANFLVNARFQRNSYLEYVQLGMPFSTWSKVPGYSYNDSKEAFLTFIVVAYKFLETAEKEGRGYRIPMKRMMQFLQRFNADWVNRYDPQNDNPRASAFRATLWAAAMSHAFQKDLRAEFRAINFPISDADWAFLNPSLFSVSTNALSLSAAASSATSVSVTSTVDSWTVASSQPWLTPSSFRGGGNQTFTLTATANMSISSRSAVVTVSATGFEDQVITVTQAGAAASLAVSSSVLTAGASGGVLALTVSSNTSWTVGNTSTWLSTASSGTLNQPVSVTVQPNQSVTPRSATLIVTAVGAPTQTVIISQAGTVATLSTSTASLTVDAAGASTSFGITSNTSWSVSSSQPWLTATPTSGSGAATITLTAATHTQPDTRTATVSVVATGVSAQTITLTQRGIIILAVPTEPELLPILYPNPVSSQLQIKDLPRNSTIRLYDEQGRLVHLGQTKGTAATISLDSVPAGIYFVYIEAQQATVVRRVMKR